MNILYVTELPEVFWTLGTKLSRVLSFFTLRRDFMDLKTLVPDPEKNNISEDQTTAGTFVGNMD